ncbi:hypothetical protein RSK20926_16077 [Roseobacter sp. SK209-2-6]|nr:hypothetical protein RSK20926_16077 [Roseobacter sp. SK209-2-6]
MQTSGLGGALAPPGAMRHIEQEDPGLSLSYNYD